MITCGSAASSIASSSRRLSPCASEPARVQRAALEADARRAPSARLLHRGAHARRATPEPQRPAERGLRGEPHVLEHGQQREDARHLERPPQARARAPERRLPGDVAPAQLDRPGGRPVQPREQVEERRLARAVRADDAEQLALGNLERDIGDDLCAADVEPEVARGENRRVRHAVRVSGNGWTGGWTLPGRDRLEPLRLVLAVLLLDELDR